MYHYLTRKTPFSYILALKPVGLSCVLRAKAMKFLILAPDMQLGQ